MKNLKDNQIVQMILKEFTDDFQPSIYANSNTRNNVHYEGRSQN